MDLLREKVGRLYTRYLAAAFGSALISSIYGMVDMAMVGQYQGPEGTAALAVVAPIWNLIYSMGLLTGIGGSVLFSTARGSGARGAEGEAQYFTAALLGSLVLAALCWGVVGFFDAPLLRFFGAEDTLLPLARQYLLPVKFGVPLFLLNQMLSCFLRNDGAPGLATGAVLAGGIFNVFGDYFFVFGLDMGIFGAGLATVLGALITFCVLLSHLFSPKNTLRMVRPTRLAVRLGKIGTAGFSACFVDAAMGILTILFNRQIMAYAGADALAVYGILVNISTFVQCCAYSVDRLPSPFSPSTSAPADGTASGPPCAGLYWLPRSSASSGRRRPWGRPWPSSISLCRPQTRCWPSPPPSSAVMVSPSCCCPSISSPPITFNPCCALCPPWRCRWPAAR